jgi:hypothetical protein
MRDHLHVWSIKGTEYFILQEIGTQDYIVGKRLATSWTVQGSNPDGGQIFHAIQTGPAEPNPVSCTEGTESFPGVSGQSVLLTTHHLLVPGCKWVKSYTSADPLCLHSCVMGWLLLVQKELNNELWT